VAALLRRAGETALASDARVTDAATRSRNINFLYAELARIVATRTTTEWVEALKDADIPMTPVRSPEELLEDPHLAALDFFHRSTHPSEGELRTIGIPVTFSRTPGAFARYLRSSASTRRRSSMSKSRYFVRAEEVPATTPPTTSAR
jgi:crotonobetainyl-CoA:carnitine CoA-transferase CaiB-like acyl-CoA transferase